MKDGKQKLDQLRDLARLAGMMSFLVWSASLVAEVSATTAERAGSTDITADVTAEDQGADCIRVTDSGYEIQAQKIGGADVDWQATLENRCEVELDVQLSLHAVGDDDSSLYSVQTVQLFRSGETRVLDGAFYISSHVADNIKEFAVRVVRGHSRI